MRDWLRQNVASRGTGYEHFKKAHTQVLARGDDCRKCHTGQLPAMALSASTLDRRTLTASCLTCHAAQE